MKNPFYHSSAPLVPGSQQAAALLAEWETAARKLVRVIAKERADLEAAEEKHEAASTPK